MVDTLRGFSRDCIPAAQLMDLQAFAATRAIAIDMTAQVRASIAQAAPGLRIKGRGSRPARIGAGYRIDKTSDNTAIVFARGPLQLLERDTSPHRIPKAGAKRRRKYQRARDASGRILKKSEPGYFKPIVVRKAGKVLNIPGIGYRASAQHPGTKGKHPFMRAVESYEASKKATAIYSRHVRKVLRSFDQ